MSVQRRVAFKSMLKGTDWIQLTQERGTRGSFPGGKEAGA